MSSDSESACVTSCDCCKSCAEVIRGNSSHLCCVCTTRGVGLLAQFDSIGSNLSGPKGQFRHTQPYRTIQIWPVGPIWIWFVYMCVCVCVCVVCVCACVHVCVCVFSPLQEVARDSCTFFTYSYTQTICSAGRLSGTKHFFVIIMTINAFVHCMFFLKQHCPPILPLSIKCLWEAYIQLCQHIECVVYGMLCIVCVLYCIFNSLSLLYLHCVFCVHCVLAELLTHFSLPWPHWVYCVYCPSLPSAASLMNGKCCCLLAMKAEWDSPHVYNVYTPWQCTSVLHTKVWDR